MGVMFDIQSALQKEVNDINNHPKIVFDNDKAYKPVKGTKYWRTTHMPGRSEIASSDMMQKHQGLFQVDVFVPEYSGLKDLMDDLDLIYAKYNTIASLQKNDTRVDVINVGRGGISYRNGWCSSYIEVYYNCYSY